MFVEVRRDRRRGHQAVHGDCGGWRAEIQRKRAGLPATSSRGRGQRADKGLDLADGEGAVGEGKERGVGRRGREAVEGEMRSSRRQHRCCGRQRGPPAQSFLCPTHAAQAGPRLRSSSTVCYVSDDSLENLTHYASNRGWRFRHDTSRETALPPKSTIKRTQKPFALTPELCNTNQHTLTSHHAKRRTAQKTRRLQQHYYRYRDWAATMSLLTLVSAVSNLLSSSSLPITLAACAICRRHSSSRRNTRIRLPS